MTQTPFSEPHAIARLVIVGDEKPSTVFPLYGDQVIIGRIDSADLQIDDGRVSRLHARLRRVDLGFVVEDLDSRGGTHINGTPLDQPHRLQDGDQIQIGGVCLRYEE